MTTRLPTIPPNMPRMGNALTRAIGKMCLRLWGWRVEGELPDKKKLVLILEPHTSNWDFFVGIAFVLALNLKVRFLMKHQMVRFPVRGLLRWLGGIAVNRDNASGVTAQVAKTFADHDTFWLGLAPTGSRSKPEWRSGFMHIAAAADVPVLLIGIDGPNKAFVIDRLFDAGGDAKQKVAALQTYVEQTYVGIRPRK